MAHPDTEWPSQQNILIFFLSYFSIFNAICRYNFGPPVTACAAHWGYGWRMIRISVLVICTTTSPPCPNLGVYPGYVKKKLAAVSIFVDTIAGSWDLFIHFYRSIFL